MRKMILVAVACVLGLGLTATNADATTLTVGDAYYIGNILDGVPSSEVDEVGYINTLKGLAPGAASQLIGTEYYNRVSSTLDTTAFPDAVVLDSVRNASGQYSGIDVDGFTYILGKYDGGNTGAGAYVWYVAGLTEVSIPAVLPGPDQYGLSHYTLFNPFGTHETPDGGMTLMLLGGALVGLDALRRRLIA
ncbi:MAG: hypothetical protein IT158_00895 [Bryobacterales bacterium]|nr:hypothetical protein [Bryobacterales bacterium]